MSSAGSMQHGPPEPQTERTISRSSSACASRSTSGGPAQVRPAARHRLLGRPLTPPGPVFAVLGRPDQPGQRVAAIRARRSMFRFRFQAARRSAASCSVSTRK